MAVPKGDSFHQSRRSTYADSKGTFEIGGILPGSYSVVAVSYGDEKRTFATQTIDIADADIEGINLLLKPGAAIPGRIRIEGNLESKGSDIIVGLRSEDPDAAYGGCGARVQEDLTFTLKECPDGDFRLRGFGLPADAYIKAAHAGSTDILDEPLQVAGALKPLEIVISTNGGRVEGTVTDEKNNAFPGARVVLVPDEPRRKREELYKSGNTDQYGRFSLRGVTPGAYTIYAWESLDGDSFMDPDFYEDLCRFRQIGPVSESLQVTVDLKVIPDRETTTMATKCYCFLLNLRPRVL